MANQTINVIVNSRGAVTVIKELNAMGAAARSTTTYLNGLRAILATALTFSGASAIIEIADNFTVLQNRLRQVSDGSTTVGDSWNRLMAIANSSYSTIDGTVNLYFRVAQAYKAWGQSAEEAYKFTDLFQKSAILSGSSMQTTSQAVYQFGQALNKGKLDGDEFRSVLEGLPYVATLIQKELGITRSELYEWSKEGKISVDRITKAFTNAAKVIEKDWKNITPTIGMALIVLKNNWTDFIGQIQTSTGVFSIFARLILTIANNFNTLAIALAPVAIAFVWMAGRLGIGLLVIAFRDLAATLHLATAAQWLFNLAVTANPIALVVVAIAAVVAGLIYFRNEIGLTNENLSLLWQSAVSTFTAIVAYLSPIASAITNVVKQFLYWTSLFPIILNGAKILWNFIVQAFTEMGKVVAKAATYIRQSFIPVWKEIAALVKNIMDLVNDLVVFFKERFAPAIKDLKSAWDILYAVMHPGLVTIMDIVAKIYEGWQFIGEFLKGVFKTYIKTIFDFWINYLKMVISFINNIISLLRTAVALMRSLGGGKGGGGGGGAHYGAQFKAGEGFATGGQFKVGGTGAGRDTTPVAFRAERGERVTVETKKQQRQADNANNETSVNVPVSVINVLDPNMVIEAMQTATGQRTVMNVMKANRDEINYILGAA